MIQGGVTRLLVVGRSATAIKAKVKAYRYRFDGQGHINFWQQSMACYIIISTFDFKVQFMQVYNVTQNGT